MKDTKDYNHSIKNKKDQNEMIRMYEDDMTKPMIWHVNLKNNKMKNSQKKQKQETQRDLSSKEAN